MKASEARKITNENLRGPAIEAYVKVLDQHIREVASEGKNSFDPSVILYNTKGLPAPSHEILRALKVHYRYDGFSWEDHPDPDPGHPASRSHTTLSW